jgi:hypothetical protein
MDEILTAPLFYLMPAPFGVLMGVFAGKGAFNPWLAAGLSAFAGGFHAALRFEDVSLTLLSALTGIIWVVITIALYPIFRRQGNDKS